MFLKRSFKLLVAVTLLCVSTLPVSGASARSVTVATISGQVSADVGPPLGTIDLQIQAYAMDTGGIVASGGGHKAYFFGTPIEFTRYRINQISIDSDQAVVLHGAVRESTASGLVNAPLLIRGQTDGVLNVTIGPIPGGPFAGQTFVFTGTGSIVVQTCAEAPPGSAGGLQPKRCSPN